MTKGTIRVASADPGVTGAIFFADIDVDNKTVSNMTIYDMPVSSTCDVWKSEEDAQIQPDEVMILDLLRKERPDIAIVEHLTPRPPRGKGKGKAFGGGAVQEWRLSAGYAALRSAFRIYFFDRGDGPAVIPARPEIWKKAMELSPDKDHSRLRAIETFPDQAAMLKRKKDHNRGEAMLLLDYFIKEIMPRGTAGVAVF